MQTAKITLFIFIFFVLLSVGAPAQTLNCGGIGGVIRSANVTIPQRGSATPLQAKVFAPDASLQTAPCPAISILPGGGGSPISTVEWAAQRLAASGYVVIIAKPELPNSVTSYDNAARSGIDYLVSAANPYLTGTNTNIIGVAGWSLGAFALSITQEQDARVKAYIGWDNLVLSETGDASTANCTGAPTTVRTARVPAMGQASDTCNDGRSADAKKTAFEHWKLAGQPTMQLVFKNATHTWWHESATPAQHDLLHYYNRAWFDRWLKKDLSATARLTARTVNGTPVGTLLSSIFRSGAFFDGYNCGDFAANCAFVSPQHKVFDFDGDGKSDYVAVQANGGNLTWHILQSAAGYRAVVFGVPTDVLVPGDYDGDGKWDVAVWRAGSPSVFWILNSATNSVTAASWGISGDNPRPTQDFDGDGKADPTVVRTENGRLIWYILQSVLGFKAAQFGLENDFALRGDYDGDGKADIAVYRGRPADQTNTFYILRSGDNGFQATQFGLGGADHVVPADFDGDGKTDIAVFRFTQPGPAFWYWLQSSDGAFRALHFGTGASGGQADFAAPGDYDGDGRTDQSVRRVNNSQPDSAPFYVNQSSAGFSIVQWGTLNMETPNYTLQVAATDHP